MEMINVWFPNLYGVKPVETPQKVQEEEYVDEVKKRKKQEAEARRKAEADSVAFERDIIDRYYRE